MNHTVIVDQTARKALDRHDHCRCGVGTALDLGQQAEPSRTLESARL